MPRRRSLPSTHASAAMRDAMDAAAVLSFRLPMLSLNAVAPTHARDREQARMVSEKTAAAMAGAASASIEMWRLGMTAWTAPLTPDAAVRALTRAATAPGRRTLRANARRLKARRTI